MALTLGGVGYFVNEAHPMPCLAILTILQNNKIE